MNNFLDAFMPTLPWLCLALTLSACLAWMTLRTAQMLNARRHRVERPVKALRQAKDALATVISDPAVFGAARDQALSAYDSVAGALSKENSTT